MFATSLSNVEPFVGNRMYDSVLNNWVRGDPIGDDVSMVATLRSLLHSRSDKTFWFRFKQTSYLPAQVSDGNDLFTRLARNAFALEPNSMYIVSANITESEFDDVCNNLENAETNPWNPEKENKVLRLQAAEDYIKSRMHKNIRLYVFPEMDSCVVLVKDINYPTLHLIESFTPLYFPRLLKEKPITADERAMLESLTQRNPDAYREAIAKLAEQFDFRNQIIENNLVQFELTNREHMLDAAKAQLDLIRTQADKLANDYQMKLLSLQESTIRFEGLRQMKEAEKNNRDLADYFLAHKNLKLVYVEGSRLDFIVSTFLDSFDVDAYNHFKENRDI